MPTKRDSSPSSKPRKASRSKVGAATKPAAPVAAFDFDVAFSFLDKDKSLALRLEAKLQPKLNVFVYATRQGMLAGTDGLESFRTVFNSKSRLAVVLYRDGWGDTKFTRIEQNAIRDRGLDDQWENFLLFVTLNDSDPVPAWLPKRHIRLSYSEFGFDEVVSAIKNRARAIGATPRSENVLQEALRLKEEHDVREERQIALSANNVSLGPAQSEVSLVFDQLEERVSKLRSAVPTLDLVWHRNQIESFSIRTRATSVRIATDGSRLHLLEFYGQIRFDGEGGFYMPGPKKVGQHDYGVDFDRAYGGWCWKSSDRLLTSAEVAEDIAKRIVELQDGADRGRFEGYRDDFWSGR